MEYFGKKKPVSIKFKIGSVRSYVEEERKRLLKLKKDGRDWWNSPNRSDWARERFGKTLKEKDGLTYFSRIKVRYVCDACGKTFVNPDEKFIEITCNAKDHGSFHADICLNCVNKLFTDFGDVVKKILGEGK